jgi:beta-barrel assembly-enhancing protease
MRLRFFTSVVLLICLPLTTWGFTLDDERKAGKEVHLEVLASFRVDQDPYVCLYMGNIAKNLEPSANLPWPIKLTVVKSTTPNAFATMGGYVYVTTGLIEMSDREEEVAGVLAHELAHVGRRHVTKRMEKEKPLSYAAIAAMLLSVLIPGGAAVTQALVTSTMAATQAISLKYSRDDEDEADRFGLVTAEGAGYTGHGIADFLKKMRATEYEKAVPQYLLTHPYSEDRAAKIESRVSLQKNTVKTDFFPYVVVRLKVLDKQLSPAIEDTWLKKYEKDPKDPVSAYGAALVYSLKGNVSQAASVIQNMDSPYRNLFLGEILIRGQSFKEAIEALRDGSDPISLYFLALALEGGGEAPQAAEVLRGLLPYKDTFPAIYQKYGMVVGRLGNEGRGFEYLGRYYIEIGRKDAARIYLEKAIAKYGRNTAEGKEAQVLLAEVINPKGKPEPKDKNQKLLPAP